MLLVVILVGWIWSIAQGACIYKKSKQFADAQAAPKVPEVTPVAEDTAAPAEAPADTPADAPVEASE